MKRFLLLVLAAASITLGGCHISYDRQIECPSFSATNVAVYKFDADTWIVIYPPDDPRTHDLVNDAGCKVTAAR